MSVALLTRGMIAPQGGSGDTEAPVITVISEPEVSTDPYVVSVYDESGLGYFQVTCSENNKRFVAYSTDEGFIHPFSGKSSISGSGTLVDPYILTIYRRGRWPTGVLFTLDPKGFDTDGNEANG